MKYYITCNQLNDINKLLYLYIISYIMSLILNDNSKQIILDKKQANKLECALNIADKNKSMVHIGDILYSFSIGYNDVTLNVTPYDLTVLNELLSQIL